MNNYEKNFPVGIDDFEKLRKENYYYIDKTVMIRDLLKSPAEVTLFTRPRRFGKSLNMSMLENFFSVEGDKSIFDGLTIAGEKALCEKHMGKYPVISFSLKNLDAASDFRTAKELMECLVQGAARKAQYLSESSNLSEADKEVYAHLLYNKMNEGELLGSFRILCELLEKHHGQKAVVLIDEYDVPLAKAFERDFYDQMVNMIRGILGQVLKTNNSLQFAVLTGCMRISKESIFTGLNNFTVFSCSDVEFDEYFGFTDEEVRKLLEDFRLSGHYDAIKEWYDGYRFGDTEVYCPWDVLCYCRKLLSDPELRPQNYWINTSSNDIVRRFIQRSENQTTKREIERLVAGEEIVKELHPELTYQDMYTTIENLWSVLFTTGYLTQRGKPDGNLYRLAIPNMEIRNIFTTQIMEYFKESIKKDGETLNRLCTALENGDADKVEQYFTTYLKKTISIRDTFVQRELKENFYHGMLLGILGMKDSWAIFSNREAGDGYSDIIAETEDSQMGIIIEVKYAHDGNLEKSSQEALEQIRTTRYDEELKENGVGKILRYGIACYLKRCRVVME